MMPPGYALRPLIRMMNHEVQGRLNSQGLGTTGSLFLEGFDRVTKQENKLGFLWNHVPSCSACWGSESPWRCPSPRPYTVVQWASDLLPSPSVHRRKTPRCFCWLLHHLFVETNLQFQQYIFCEALPAETLDTFPKICLLTEDEVGFV